MATEAIQCVWSYFSYAVKQNIGDSTKIAKISLQIPRHAFKDQSTCYDWCKSVADKENYEHRRVPGGFQSQLLFKDLENLFKDLSMSSQKFSHTSSSQANESLNASMASAAPKSRCYSLGPSANFRMAKTAAKKNLGEF